MKYYINSDGKLPTQGGKPVLITREQYQQCCCDQVGGRLFILWVWDCVSGDWLIHPYQSAGFSWDYPDEWILLYGDIGRGPATLTYKLEGDAWDKYRTYLTNGPSAGNPFDDRWFGVTYAEEAEGVLAEGALGANGLPDGYQKYRNFLLKSYLVNPPANIVGDIIYEGNWTAAGKQFFYLPINQACRDKITAGDPLNGCLCDMLFFSTTIVAVTVGSIVTSSFGEADFPAPPPAPPTAWLDYFCNDDCASSETPPDSPAVDPEPDELCQRYDEYDWNCYDEIWEFVNTGKAVPTAPRGRVDVTGPLSRRVWGEVGDCDAELGSGGAPKDNPDEFQLEFCPAPTTCPCTEVDPSTWPCGGLNETYTITQWEYSFVVGSNTRIWRLKTPHVVTDRTNDLCGYSNSSNADVEISLDSGATWADTSSVFISLSLSASLGWEVLAQLDGVPNFIATHKTTGKTFVGFYEENVRYNGSVTGRMNTATVTT